MGCGLLGFSGVLLEDLQMIQMNVLGKSRHLTEDWMQVIICGLSGNLTFFHTQLNISSLFSCLREAVIVECHMAFKAVKNLRESFVFMY